MSNPQTHDLTNPEPIWEINAAWCNGVSPGYWPTAGNTPLTLNLSAGTSFANGSKVSYAGGTLTLPDNSTSYIYLDPTASNAPASNTSAYPAGAIPIAVVVTASGAITSISDDRTWYVAQIPGGVDDQTGASSYTIALSDLGKLLKFGNSSGVSVTLPPTLGGRFACAFENLGGGSPLSGSVLLTPASGTINLQASLSIAVGSGGWLFFDGTNWTAVVGGGGGGGSGTVTSVGLSMPAEFSVSGSPVTSSGTLSVTKANESANTVWAGPTSGGAAAPTFRALVAGDIPNISPLTTKGDIWGRSSVDARIPVGSDGQWLEADSTQTLGVKWANQPYDLGFQISNKPPANTRYLWWVFTRAVTFPGNFSGAAGDCLTNPSSSATFTLEKNGVNCGTVVINTSGVFSFTSASGSPVTFSSGDRLSVVTPNPQDSTLSDVAFTLAGTR